MIWSHFFNNILADKAAKQYFVERHPMYFLPIKLLEMRCPGIFETLLLKATWQLFKSVPLSPYKHEQEKKTSRRNKRVRRKNLRRKLAG